MIDWQVIQGDAAYMPIADESIDLTVTSPPYDSLRTYNGFKFDFEKVAKELYRVAKKGGVVVWVVGDATINGSETGTSFRQALYFKDVCGFNLHDTMIYEKDGCPYPETNRYYPSFEFMFVLSKNKPTKFHLLADKKNKYAFSKVARARAGRLANGILAPNSAFVNGLDRQTKEFGVRGNIWRYESGLQKSSLDSYAFQHPAIFPEALVRDHILSWSNEGDTVLDPFCGSGTTGKMSVIHNRKFIGIELSKEYCELSRVRITRACGQYAEIPKPIRQEKELPLFAA